MSNTSQERVLSALHGLTLSRKMLDLLGALVIAIDKRHEILLDAEEPEHIPDTCGVCQGTGYILIPLEALNGSPDTKGKGVATKAGKAVQTAPSSGSSSSTKDRAEMTMMLGIPTRNSASASVSAPAPTPAQPSFATADLSPAPILSVPAAPVVTGPGPAPPAAPATVTPAPVATNVTTSAPLTAPTIVPTHAPLAPAVSSIVHMPALSASFAGAHAPVPTALPVPGLGSNIPAAAVPTAGSTLIVPPPSTVIPGLACLGPNTPVPAPEDAAFAAPGAPRYYTITKGICVGIFAGWGNALPYVTGVASASFSHHTNIYTAFEDYCKAFINTSVSYA
ncbi:hypothetical protein FA13DRAFT_1709961 [Coprinellus micaceus]|uniref:Uncharacterized protein n=1 Tax=Coprinellus micaceus TaxID=71717 RepID=A0A4Y7TB11_COPMI|nr:hypothetical protein FA13DRAFT_1709961 [Coprinellus micaceus]